MREFAKLSIPFWAQRLWVELGLALAVGLVLAFMGPFKTFKADLVTRMGYWIFLSALWFVVFRVVDAMIARIPQLHRMPEGYLLGLKIGIAGLPILFAVAPTTQIAMAGHNLPECLISYYPKVLLIGAGLTLVSAALFDGFASPLRVPGRLRLVDDPLIDSGLDRSVRHPSIEDCPVRCKLPPSMRGEILCLEMEDHYVRVHSSAGSALILMRLTDAIAAMEVVGGCRVHRSWWVATGAVAALVRQRRVLRLKLHNGLFVPVSQSYRRDVIERFGAGS